MKLPDIPDKYAKSELWILSGQQLIARKYPWDKTWRVKKDECNRCGECCMGEPHSRISVFKNDEEGKCEMLVRNGDMWECGANQDKPYKCLGDPDFVDCCSITYDEVDCG